jgi:flavin-dependent dehydrogenase
MPVVCIIGAGPAGSVAGICLARAGLEVHLFEQHRFPREKVCGECLSPLALAVLEEIGLSAQLQDLHPASLHRAVLVEPRGRQASIRLPAVMWGLSRNALDTTLLEAARGAGAVVHQPARVEGVDSIRQCLTVRDLENNQSGQHHFDQLIIADGKAALALPRPAPTGDLGVKAHFTNVDDAADAITLLGLNGHYCGLAPIEGDRWNVAMNVPARRVREVQGDLERLWEMLLDENAGLSRRLRHAHRVSAWLASPLPRFPVQQAWPPHVIPIGNAAAALEPIGGEGMGLAMRSAQLAAQSLLTQGTRNLTSNYRRLWNRRRLICRTGAVIISNATLARLAISVLDCNSAIGEAFVRWTGKPPALRPASALSR